MTHTATTTGSQSATVGAAPEGSFPRTVLEALARTVEQRADEPAFSDSRLRLTWGQLDDRARTLAAGFLADGLEPGQPVALLLTNRPEFHIADLAAMLLGSPTLSLYATAPVEQMHYILNDSQARILVTETAFLPSALSAIEGLSEAPTVVVVDPDASGDKNIRSLEQVEDTGRESAVDISPHVQAVTPETSVVYIYTSGTTGTPKCVELTHHNAMAALHGTVSRIPLSPDSILISWLPAAHVAERLAHHYVPILVGLQVVCCPDPRKIAEFLVEAEPTWFFGVPRIWEKLKAGIEAMIERMEPCEAARAREAIEVGRQRVALEQSGKPITAELQAKYDEADATVLAGFRRSLGFSRLTAGNVGSAPTPDDVMVFFHSLGVPLSGVYGLSESFAVGASHPVDGIRIGSVGLPQEGVDLRIAADGEILIRAAAVMKHYRNNPDETARAMRDGWLYTGDIGALDDDGYLTIVDRKKEIIINAAGKNIAPTHVESLLKSESPLIGQACCIGEGRPYLVALIVLDAEFAPAWAARHGVVDLAPSALATDERVLEALDAAVRATNAKVSRPEQIKKFHVIAGEWTSGDELTPTLKLRRNAITEKFRAEIEALYAATTSQSDQVVVGGSDPSIGSVS